MPKTDDLIRWMQMSEKSVFHVFSTLPGAFKDGSGREAFVYIAGTRKDKALLIAHTDTVWGNIEIKPKVYGDLIASDQVDTKIKVQYASGKKGVMKGVGLGADDRAGCAILWELRNLGHSLLILSGEESGSIAARRIMKSKWWKGEIAKHAFAIEFDRRGDNDIVFYDVGTRDFASYVEKSTKYKPAIGSFTDICVLCEDICGVNMSVGYTFEHSPHETLDVSDWTKTLNTAGEWLSKPLTQFKLYANELFEVEIERKKKGNAAFLQGLLNDYKDVDRRSLAPESLFAGVVVCNACGARHSLHELYMNRMRCICGVEMDV